MMDHPSDLYHDVIFKIATQRNIPALWMMSIIQQESNWNPYSIRYESTYRYLFKPEEFKINSLQTELIAQRTSWGLGQIMGGIAREQGHMGFLSELIDASINLEHMGILIQNLMNHSENKDDVFAMYNGGMGALQKPNGKYSNQSYVDSVNRHLTELSAVET